MPARRPSARDEAGPVVQPLVGDLVVGDRNQVPHTFVRAGGSSEMRPPTRSRHGPPRCSRDLTHQSMRILPTASRPSTCTCKYSPHLPNLEHSPTRASRRYRYAGGCWYSTLYGRTTVLAFVLGVLTSSSPASALFGLVGAFRPELLRGNSWLSPRPCALALCGAQVRRRRITATARMPARVGSLDATRAVHFYGCRTWWPLTQCVRA